MYFKPRIFISSTFSENKDLRQKIDEYFKSVGAEPLLYEKELTPSVLPNTYRTDLLDADFMILIIKESYGTETKTGMSGIHEEFLIARNHNVPIHVYLKRQKETDDNPLMDEIKSSGVSYYYFDNDDDLLKRLQETTFTIAKEIMLSKVSADNISYDSLSKLAEKLDYDRGIEVISIVESALETSKVLEMDLVYSDILVQLTDRFNCEFGIKPHKFINWKLDDIMQEMLKIANEFSSHSTQDFMANGNYRTVKLPVIGEIDFCSLHTKGNTWGIDNYKELLRSLREKYQEFKDLLNEIYMESSIVR